MHFVQCKGLKLSYSYNRYDWLLNESQKLSKAISTFQELLIKTFFNICIFKDGRQDWIVIVTCYYLRAWSISTMAQPQIYN